VLKPTRLTNELLFFPKRVFKLMTSSITAKKKTSAMKKIAVILTLVATILSCNKGNDSSDYLNDWEREILTL